MTGEDVVGPLADEGGSDPAADTQDVRAAALLRTFVRDGRLVRLPARWERKKVVLRHVAEHTFAVGRTYTEPEVNGLLRPWCEGGAADHASLRRHLVDLGHLDRRDGVYRRLPGGTESVESS